MKTIHPLLLLVLLITACSPKSIPTVTQQKWGTVGDTSVYLYTLKNAQGLMAKITNYGGIITELYTPDRQGKLENIVLGLHSLDAYLKGHPAFGCIVGRYINRIGGAQFTLDGVTYPLTVNSSGKHHIHGGKENFYNKIWKTTTSTNAHSATLSLTYHSPHLEEGYPGNLQVRVDYILTNRNTLRIEYHATTDRPTVVNLSNHSYFNLSGGKENVLSHHVRLYADEYLPTDADLIPTGAIKSVKDTPLDLREWTPIGSRMQQLPQGFDHSFCVKGKTGKAPTLVAEMRHPQSGRTLKTYTTQPGLCFYTAKTLQTRKYTTHGIPYDNSWGACFETQHHPDSPNHPHFPSTVLRPGETYHQVTVYEFGVEKE